MFVSHDHVTELPEEVSLKRLSEEVTKHLQHRTMTNHGSLRLNPVFHPEVSDVNMPRFGPGGHATVSFQRNRTLVVLLKDVLRNGISLCSKEILHPNCVQEEVITRANELSFSGALRVKLAWSICIGFRRARRT